MKTLDLEGLLRRRKHLEGRRPLERNEERGEGRAREAEAADIVKREWELAEEARRRLCMPNVLIIFQS